MLAVWQFFTKTRGEPYWRIFLYATAVAGLIGIPLVTLYPTTVPYVWLWLVGIPANSPVAPLFPTAFEPLMMEVVKYKPVVNVATVSTAIFVYMEFINWYAFKWILSWDKLDGFRGHRWVDWGVKRFAKAPRSTVLIFAATPLPFWIARTLAILNEMPFWPYMVLMAIGRFPRLLIYAWLGATIQLPTFVLIFLAVGTGFAAILWRLARRKPILEGSILDRSPVAPRPPKEQLR